MATAASRLSLLSENQIVVRMKERNPLTQTGAQTTYCKEPGGKICPQRITSPLFAITVNAFVRINIQSKSNTAI